MPLSDFKDQSIWIIGASSGIGAALARELSARGAKIFLSARQEGKLQSLARELGPDHQSLPLDAAQPGAIAAAFTTISTRKIDRVIYLAATYEPGKISAMDMDHARQMIAVNLTGALEMLHTILPVMEAKGHGQIALCGSVAGYTGLPGGQPYSATKAAIINLAESLHAEMKSKNIDVKLISPGFVETPMTDKNNFDMPAIISPESAARYIAQGLQSKTFEIHFPKKFTFFMKLLRILPYGLRLWLTGNIRP